VPRKSSRISLIWVLFILSVLPLSMNISLSQMRGSDLVVSVIRSTSQNYTPCAPINITNDDELAVVATRGMGMVTDPYIISGWIITDSPTDGISITGTTKHFRIEKCWIVNSTDCGIYVANLARGTANIINNTCTNNGRGGIFVGTSAFSTLTDNICNDNGFHTIWDEPLSSGITLSNSSSSTIVNNTCTNNVEIGIYFNWSYSPSVANNTCLNNSRIGIYLTDSHSPSVVNNTCTDNSWEGIFLRGSHFSTAANNTCVSNRRGIFLDGTDDSSVTNNTCSNNDWSGIHLKYSDSSRLVNNTCTHNDETGIYLNWSYYSIIINNTCTGNNWDGINLGTSSSSTIAYNTCNSNREDGIFLYYSDSNLIVWNTLVGNGDYGIGVSEDSENNYIHHNSFISNGQNNSQAFDNGTSNQWHDETLREGNYWSDYNGMGSYFIAGSAGASDLYPTGDLHQPTPSGTNLSGFFFLLARICLFLGILGVLIITIFLSRRKHFNLYNEKFSG
jgi:parallel beta-helix repeat protein